MNNKELISAIAQKSGLTKGNVKIMIDTLDDILLNIEGENEVKIGTTLVVWVEHKEPGTVRNPKTGELKSVGLRKTVKAKVCHSMKQKYKNAEV